MNITIKYLAIVVMAAFTSCSLLEPNDENILGEERLNYDPAFAEGLLIQAYQDLDYQKSRTDMTTDDATYNDNPWERRMAMGEWSASFSPTNQWGDYRTVLYINKFLAAIDQVSWKIDEESNQLFKDRNRGEALAMRALRHFWILREHAGYTEDGVLMGIPYLDAWIPSNGDFNIPRLTFEESVDRIIADFTEALIYLPKDWNGDYLARPERYKDSSADKYKYIFGDFQKFRMNGRYAKAFMAKVHLMAASPAYLNGAGHYEKAAALLSELIADNKGLAGVDPKGHHNWYTIGEGDLAEFFWRKGGPISTSDTGFEKDNFPPSFRGKGRINPSQGLVDAFYMSNGKPATVQNGLNLNDPYANRDPRLKLYILYNGNDLGGRKVKTGYDAEDDMVNSKYELSTRTGYYIKKHTYETVTINTDQSTGAVKKRDFLIRYTDLYLMFAEVLNEIGGPDYADGSGISAAQIMRKIRNRSLGIATDPYLDEVIAGGKESMREFIRHERRLELCFEGHRFYDLRRWGLLNPSLPSIKGAFFTGTTYNIFDVEPRSYPTYGNYAPIPQNEVLKFSNLKQNKGW